MTSPYEIVRETFAGFKPQGDLEEAWKKFLHDGFLANTAAKAVEVKVKDLSAGQMWMGIITNVLPLVLTVLFFLFLSSFL